MPLISVEVDCNVCTDEMNVHMQIQSLLALTKCFLANDLGSEQNALGKQ